MLWPFCQCEEIQPGFRNSWMRDDNPDFNSPGFGGIKKIRPALTILFFLCCNHNTREFSRIDKLDVEDRALD